MSIQEARFFRYIMSLTLICVVTATSSCDDRPVNPVNHDFRLKYTPSGIDTASTWTIYRRSNGEWVRLHAFVEPPIAVDDDFVAFLALVTVEGDARVSDPYAVPHLFCADGDGNVVDMTDYLMACAAVSAGDGEDATTYGRNNEILFALPIGEKVVADGTIAFCLGPKVGIPGKPSEIQVTIEIGKLKQSFHRKRSSLERSAE